ncbi:Mdy2p [Sugiyamaella lignohabitans]|uniref:Mdy2p n=1 Tax=Sugiyamaella lignohabitans TaxID=796027 RepID=A0A167DAL4_9ASCO|nr:Mdy2p [Sugiyamaella lignohabitans]ANB12682.1 Mdy2p [Sugiyamaella lignohabitans]
MPQAKKKTLQSDDSKTESSVSVTLKSIRNPKFVISFDDVPANDTVLSIKERLVGDPDGPLAEGGYATSNVRLLIKGKVISDSKTVGEVSTATEGSDELSVSFVAMISQPDKEAISNKKEVGSEEEPEPVLPTVLSEAAWNDIHTTLQKHLSHDEARVALQKFKSTF